MFYSYDIEKATIKDRMKQKDLDKERVKTTLKAMKDVTTGNSCCEQAEDITRERTRHK